MADYFFEADGSVKTDQFGQVVAFFEDDGTIKSDRFGQVIGFVEDDGTVKTDRFGQTLGIVESDGTIKDAPVAGRQVGKVEAPFLKNGALFLIRGS